MKDGLYTKLNNHWEKFNYQSCKFQNIRKSGQFEVEEIYLNYSNDTLKKKSELSKGFLELLLYVLNDELSKLEILRYVERFPVAKYYYVLVEKLKVLVNEGVINKDSLKDLGLYYVKESNDINLIKVGLTLLKSIKEDEVLEIYKMFSNHNEFIFYCIEGINEYEMCNSYIYKIGKATRGYGKLMAISSVEPLDEDIKKWIMEECAKANPLSAVITVMVLDEKIDLLEYFESCKKTEKEYKILNKILCNLFEIKDFLYENISYEIIELYNEYYRKFGGDFKSRHIFAVLLSIIVDRLEDEEPLDLSQQEKDNLGNIAEIFTYSNNELFIKKELKKSSVILSDVFEICTLLDINLEFKDFNKYLENNPFSVEVCKYIMESNSSCKEALIKDTLNKVKADYEKIILEYAAPIEVYSFLFVIISSIGKELINYPELIKYCLECCYKPVEEEAIKVLSTLKNEELERVDSLIKTILDKSKDKNTKLMLEKIYNKNSNNLKYKGYYEEEVITHIKDIFLIECSITEIINRNYFEVLTEGTEDIFLLKKSKEDKKEGKSITVIDLEGYIMGYIKDERYTILEKLLEGGKIIYGKIVEFSKDDLWIKLSIYLSHMDIIDEVAYTINMIGDVETGYIN